jgi:putative transposase
MYAFIDAHRHEYGVEPICRVLEIAPSGYYAAKQEERNPSRRSLRRQRGAVLREKIRTTHAAHFGVYGVQKIWHQQRHDGETVAWCTVARLMGVEGLQGIVRGARIRTTRPAEDPAAQAADLVQRQLTASRPNQLWVVDFTYVATWQGLVYVAFVIYVFSRLIVGWRAQRTMDTALVLDALEQALHDRPHSPGLVVHSDHGSQYVSLRYTTRLVEVGAAPSVGSVGDAYDNALAESVIGCTRPKSSPGKARAVDSIPYSTRRGSGWPGLIKYACCRPSDTFRLRSTRRSLQRHPAVPPWCRHKHNRVSSRPGAVQ